jgi:hypothetical protein
MSRRGHVRIAAAIDCIDGEFRAAYTVALGSGSQRSAIRRFAALQDARVWLEDEARLHGAELVCEEQL